MMTFPEKGDKTSPPRKTGGFRLSMDICDDQLIKEYEQYLFLADYSKSSRLNYLFTVKRYCRGRKISDINNKQLFIDLKNRTDIAPATILMRIKILKNFLRYLSQEKGLSIINVFSIHHKVPALPAPEYLEKAEIELIRKDAPLRTIVDLRTRTLFEFLIYTGCRVSEAINSDWTDIDFARNELVVVGKGNKSRVVYLGASTAWIKRYLKARVNKDAPMFLNQYGKRMSVAHVQRPFHELGKFVGLTKNLHPHLCRSTFATHMIRAGVDVKTLQLMLGHDDVQTTLKFYIGVSQDHTRAMHKEFSQILA